MSNINKFWKVGIRVLHFDGYVKDDEYKYIWDSLTPDHYGMNDRLSIINEKIYDIMSDGDELKLFLQDDIEFITTNKTPVNKLRFKSLWYSTLCDLLSVHSISEHEYEQYLTGINFSKEYWMKSEISLLNKIRNKVCINTIINTPSFINYIENPTFEMLLSANGI